MHYTAMASATAARDWLCTAQAQVSAHYVIARSGTVWQLVDEADRAWHAGAGRWGGCDDVNSASIGIELANTGFEPFAEPQMQALEALLPGIMVRWSIPPKGVIAHSDTALGRKIDPGPRFDWPRLAAQGLAVWPAPADPGEFHADARRFGYGIEAGNDDALLAAFRLRFRPQATGPLDDTDRALMADLAHRFPAD
ncbi:N-acetylmuramoyl-L-alanine amidase [Aestuariicoccus sp. MJ-SS9]|nr:N-acetylmuramoyl-L-alanine amidase [Aestuariicoccus sp. MJ-SS9]MDU8913251.1 N-acetylmuramoyl-L-alanine amidase [Aestuariicoccus sp. MJ-SS9]